MKIIKKAKEWLIVKCGGVLQAEHDAMKKYAALLEMKSGDEVVKYEGGIVVGGDDFKNAKLIVFGSDVICRDQTFKDCTAIVHPYAKHVAFLNNLFIK
jgi:hypothetical protein